MFVISNEDWIDLMNIIYSIQCDIYDSTSDSEYFDITVKSNGFAVIVEFLGIPIWNSETEDRYEPLEPHIRKLINKELNKIKQIKV